MKKILFIAVIVGMTFASCQKDEEVKPVKIEKKTMDDGDGGGGQDKSGGGYWD